MWRRLIVWDRWQRLDRASWALDAGAQRNALRVGRLNQHPDMVDLDRGRCGPHFRATKLLAGEKVCARSGIVFALVPVQNGRYHEQ